ncbi:biopolymer transporter ExbD [Marivita cryptomonadis]|uniref:Biopolymer transporter ExbD n=1 Tax=Marivita cryptomonadis TaxID=505252 RepID=A0A9Q2RZE6_9RHOB|nr:biopolymer transporter ExbD [Marivita cryptomonadis]MBM2330812.1 biopolymer transporter ExbD [Marivita cryptomonadis]MBM2340398.1 biopolymer transporter ExbD [Marivita cryptomonadis]MBM2345060.1 biopolymer transporter ExbD [Marivita cryptomonadis]MBM2349738.1 biopolymer transporter ExbD [Marivita cryptomonadis]
MALTRPKPPKALISLVPMIDVLLILLVFFMVTSTYLNLDMIPAVQRADDPAIADPQLTETAGAPMMIRIGSDGIPTVRGEGLAVPELETLFLSRLQDTPALRVLILPSGAADMQSLVSVMDAATRSGVTNLRVVRLEVAE